MSICNFDQELYYRGVSFFKSRVHRTHKVKKDGSTLPVIPRSFEEIKKPCLRRNSDWLAFFVGICIYDYENDFAIAEILNHILNIARKNQYQGGWEIWLKFVTYHNLDRCNCLDENKYKIDTCFDIPTLFDFLSDNFSDDEIFGNILNRAAYLIANCHKVQDRYRAICRRVNKPQRKRGYNDKGSLASFDSRARRLANIQEDKPEIARTDSFSHIRLWGNTKPR
jgi:hypothetical protein